LQGSSQREKREKSGGGGVSVARAVRKKTKIEVQAGVFWGKGGRVARRRMVAREELGEEQAEQGAWALLKKGVPSLEQQTNREKNCESTAGRILHKPPSPPPNTPLKLCHEENRSKTFGEKGGSPKLCRASQRKGSGTLSSERREGRIWNVTRPPICISLEKRKTEGKILSIQVLTVTAKNRQKKKLTKKGREKSRVAAKRFLLRSGLRTKKERSRGERISAKAGWRRDDDVIVSESAITKACSKMPSKGSGWVLGK